MEQKLRDLEKDYMSISNKFGPIIMPNPPPPPPGIFDTRPTNLSIGKSVIGEGQFLALAVAERRPNTNVGAATYLFAAMLADVQGIPSDQFPEFEMHFAAKVDLTRIYHSGGRWVVADMDGAAEYDELPERFRTSIMALKMAGVGETIDDVGRHVSENHYWLYMAKV